MAPEGLLQLSGATLCALCFGAHDSFLLDLDQVRVLRQSLRLLRAGQLDVQDAMFLCGKRESSALLFARFGYRRLVTHIQQHFDFVLWNTPIQCNGDPVIFAHVICREKTDFIP